MHTLSNTISKLREKKVKRKWKKHREKEKGKEEEEEAEVEKVRSGSHVENEETKLYEGKKNPRV